MHDGVLHVNGPPQTEQSHSFDGVVVEARPPFFAVFFVTVSRHLHLILVRGQPVVLVDAVGVKGWRDALGVEWLLGTRSTPENCRHLFDLMETFVRKKFFPHQLLHLPLIDIHNIIVHIFHFSVPLFHCSFMFQQANTVFFEKSGGTGISGLESPRVMDGKRGIVGEFGFFVGEGDAVF